MTPQAQVQAPKTEPTQSRVLDSEPPSLEPSHLTAWLSAEQRLQLRVKHSLAVEIFKVIASLVPLVAVRRRQEHSIFGLSTLVFRGSVDRIGGCGLVDLRRKHCADSGLGGYRGGRGIETQ